MKQPGIVFGRPIVVMARVLALTPIVVIQCGVCLIAIAGDSIAPLSAWTDATRALVVVAVSLGLRIGGGVLIWKVHGDVRRARAAVAIGRLPCPRCSHPMENRGRDTVACTECGHEAEYLAVKRAWRRVGVPS